MNVRLTKSYQNSKCFDAHIYLLKIDDWRLSFWRITHFCNVWATEAPFHGTVRRVAHLLSTFRRDAVCALEGPAFCRPYLLFLPIELYERREAHSLHKVRARKVTFISRPFRNILLNGAESRLVTLPLGKVGLSSFISVNHSGWFFSVAIGCGSM